MTGVRITQANITSSTLANIQASLARTARLQEQMSSGKTLNRASDSPSDTVTSLALRAEIGANERFSKNAADAAAWLGNVETAVTSTQELLAHVRDLTLTAASSGSKDLQAREAIATEVRSLRGELLARANTTYSGRPIFGGATAGGKAFDATGTYVGGTGADRTVDRRLDATTVMEVGASGQDLFGDGAGSVFALLDDIAAHAAGDPAALQDDLVRLDARLKQVSQVHTDVGVRTNRAESSITRADYRVEDLTGTLSGVEDIDLPKAILTLQAQEVTHQAALSAAAKVLSPTLMDFLR